MLDAISNQRKSYAVPQKNETPWAIVCSAILNLSRFSAPSLGEVFG